MTASPLYVLLEGPDDERFFSRIVRPLFAERGYEVRIWKYACEKRQLTINLIHAVRKGGHAYIFVRDLDRTPYARLRVQETLERFGHAMDAEMVVVVVPEIEGWYLAGVSEATASRLGVCVPSWRTDRITKEVFRSLIPRGISRIEFMQAILEDYDLALARKKNRSFRYFMDWFVDGEQLTPGGDESPYFSDCRGIG
ncbi:MAG TPA: hypothetical protein ENN52_00365 [Methanofollis liminatans]|uniref:DUF4276 family protein n=1 Tax=Methanofollis liminatans TaxID=2201 RepID=A0A831LPK9_9EURY|nr:hypothetical protein [Methanofollis liminatans]